MRKLVQILFFIGIVFSLYSCGISKSIHHQPELNAYNQEKPLVTKHSDTLFSSGKNYLIKNKQQNWELYVAGDALQRGLLIGALTEHLYQKQEAVFFKKVEELVPSKFRQKLLRQFLKWYNRKLYLNIPEEFKAEIFGLSQYASNDLDFIAPKYLRSLYLHGAHDIGHAVQDLALVGCSSMAVRDAKTDDGKLLVGRNFDFYAGDEFAKEKVITFVNPNQGHPFMMVSWPGMIGVVSGMNIEGLTVTINAGKSKVPLIAKTPISIVTREILQYATTVQEAIDIAKKREVFVSETIMVASAKDRKAILIEKSPDNFGVFEMQNSNQLICSNHFQSDAYIDDKRNKNHILESHSQYRFDRMTELLEENKQLNPKKMVSILRNKEGLENSSIGYGNEKALNQLLAHHGIVFKPESKMVWVSSNPYQLGEFVAYDLNEIFNKKPNDFVVLGTDSLNIAKDIFLDSEFYKDYENYRLQGKILDRAITDEKEVTSDFIENYQKLNPDLWEVYAKSGYYYFNRKMFNEAKIHFEKALSKEITTLPDKVKIEKYLKKIKRKRK